MKKIDVQKKLEQTYWSGLKFIIILLLFCIGLLAVYPSNFEEPEGYDVVETNFYCGNSRFANA